MTIVQLSNTETPVHVQARTNWRRSLHVPGRSSNPKIWAVCSPEMLTSMYQTTISQKTAYVKLVICTCYEPFLLCYNSEGRGFDPRRNHWNFSFT